MKKVVLVMVVLSGLFTGCVSKKKYVHVTDNLRYSFDSLDIRYRFLSLEYHKLKVEHEEFLSKCAAVIKIQESRLKNESQKKKEPQNKSKHVKRKK